MIMLYRLWREAPELCGIITYTPIRTGIVVNPIGFCRRQGVSFLSTPSQSIHQIPARGFRRKTYIIGFIIIIAKFLQILQCNTGLQLAVNCILIITIATKPFSTNLKIWKSEFTCPFYYCSNCFYLKKCFEKYFHWIKGLFFKKNSSS